MSTTGQTKDLYSFIDYGPSGESAGANGGLIDVGGVLYGTTSWGSGYYDEGTVFSVTTNGTGKCYTTSTRVAANTSMAPVRLRH